MNILYIGDIMGPAGVHIVEKLLPGIVKKHSIDFVIAQSENVTEGKGMSREDYHHLQSIGIDCFTGGNWSMYRDDLHGLLNDPNAPVLRPANYPSDVAGIGDKIVASEYGPVLVISLLGQIVGRDAHKELDNPLKTIDKLLDKYRDTDRVATVVNFHGDYSSEKRIIGYYLDGKVTAVIGDHWHVPTADAMILPQGTAHMTDVGMCGALHSSLGVKFESTVPRWHDGIQTRNILETEGPMQFNAVLIRSDEKTARAIEARHIQVIA